MQKTFAVVLGCIWKVSTHPFGVHPQWNILPHSQAALSSRQEQKSRARRNSIAINLNKEADNYLEGQASTPQTGFLTPKHKAGQPYGRFPLNSDHSKGAPLTQYAEQVLRQKLTRKRVDKLPSPASARPCPHPQRLRK